MLSVVKINKLLSLWFSGKVCVCVYFIVVNLVVYLYVWKRGGGNICLVPMRTLIKTVNFLQ